MADYGPYGVAQFDFSKLDPIGKFQEGAKIGRENRARRDLAKCAPDDFQCMQKVLTALDPELGVKAWQLQQQLQHQAFQEDIASKTLEQQTRTADALTAERIARGQRQQETYDAPPNALEAGIPEYVSARDTLLSNRAGGVVESALGGSGIKTIRGFAGRVASARRLSGQAWKAYVEEHTPGAYDIGTGRAASMLEGLEADAAGLGFKVPAYVKPVAPPPTGAAAAGRGAGFVGSGEAAGAAEAPLATPPPVTVSPPEATPPAAPQPHVVRTVPILPKIAKGSPEETAALKEARDTIAAHPELKEKVLQRLQDLGIGQ